MAPNHFYYAVLLAQQWPGRSPYAVHGAAEEAFGRLAGADSWYGSDRQISLFFCSLRCVIACGGPSKQPSILAWHGMAGVGAALGTRVVAFQDRVQHQRTEDVQANPLCAPLGAEDGYRYSVCVRESERERERVLVRGAISGG